MMAKKKIGIVSLTRSDWIEIYYALDTKATMIKRGDYGPQGHPGDDRRWVTHLRSIMRQIGRDGCVAAARGVKRAC
jgi:hypothetical protein